MRTNSTHLAARCLNSSSFPWWILSLAIHSSSLLALLSKRFLPAFTRLLYLYVGRANAPTEVACDQSWIRSSPRAFIPCKPFFKHSLGVPRIIQRKENAPEFDYSSFYAETGARDPLLFGGSPAFLMTRLRTAAHEETELLAVLYFPIFRVPEYSESSTRAGVRSRRNHACAADQLGILMSSKLAAAVEVFCRSVRIKTHRDDIPLHRGRPCNQEQAPKRNAPRCSKVRPIKCRRYVGRLSRRCFNIPRSTPSNPSTEPLRNRHSEYSGTRNIGNLRTRSRSRNHPVKIKCSRIRFRLVLRDDC